MNLNISSCNQLFNEICLNEKESFESLFFQEKSIERQCTIIILHGGLFVLLVKFLDIILYKLWDEILPFFFYFFKCLFFIIKEIKFQNITSNEEGYHYLILCVPKQARNCNHYNYSIVMIFNKYNIGFNFRQHGNVLHITSYFNSWLLLVCTVLCHVKRHFFFLNSYAKE